MEILTDALRLMAASQILLLSVLIGLSKNPAKVKTIGVLLMSGIFLYLVMTVLQGYLPNNPAGFLWYPAAIVPSLMLFFVWFLFEENTPIPSWMIGLTGFAMISSLWYQFLGVGMPGSPLWLYLVKISILCIAIAVVWHGRDNDLVEARFKTRNIFVFALSIITLLVISIEVLTSFNAPLKIDLLSASVILVFSFAFSVSFIHMNPLMQLVVEPAPIKRDSEDPVIIELLSRMISERLYADHDLRVGSLAAMLKVPEYQLRKKINQQLGYRNFNQFVNNYRIEEAGVKLREDQRTPVLSIALDVGFRSISSFNTAFQAQFGVSPTKYRAEMA